jgi:UDP-3-O-[3-hydroxymyristoyl] glucosamine N-acyltransferase
MKAQQIAEVTQARLLGNGDLEVKTAGSIDSAGPESMVFVDDPKFLDAALNSPASLVIAGEFAAGRQTSKALLIAPQPKLAFVRALTLLYPTPKTSPGVHSTAIVDPSAQIGKGAYIGPNTVIGANAVIGDRTIIGPNCCLNSRVRVGHDCIIKTNVTIYAGTELGDRAIIHSGVVLGSDGFGYVPDSSTGKYEKFPQIGRLRIGSDFEIGANSTVDRGALDETFIDDGVKIDNLCHVAHNVRIGKNVVIAAQTGISGSSVIADNVIVAGQVGIADHVTVEEGAILGAQCGVPSNKTIRGKGVLFWGTPARPIKQYLKELATLSRLTKK